MSGTGGDSSVEADSTHLVTVTGRCTGSDIGSDELGYMLGFFDILTGLEESTGMHMLPTK